MKIQYNYKKDVEISKELNFVIQNLNNEISTTLKIPIMDSNITKALIVNSKCLLDHYKKIIEFEELKNRNKSNEESVCSINKSNVNNKSYEKKNKLFNFIKGLKSVIFDGEKDYYEESDGDDMIESQNEILKLLITFYERIHNFVYKDSTECLKIIEILKLTSIREFANSMQEEITNFNKIKEFLVNKCQDSEKCIPIKALKIADFSIKKSLSNLFVMISEIRNVVIERKKGFYRVQEEFKLQAKNMRESFKESLAEINNKKSCLLEEKMKVNSLIAESNKKNREIEVQFIGLCKKEKDLKLLMERISTNKHAIQQYRRDTFIGIGVLIVISFIITLINRK